MAVNDIRRQLVFEDGGRPYNNRDFESIKNSLDDALQIYNQFLVPNNDKNTWLISGFGTSGSRVGTEGLVWLNGAMRIVDSDTQVNFTTNPSGVYIGIVDEETQESRLYKDGNVKPVFNLYQAKWMTQSEKTSAGLVDDEVMYFKNEAAIDTSFFSVSAYTRSLIVLNETETDTVNMTGNIELVGKNGLIIQRVSEGVIEFNQGAVSSYQHPTFTPTWDSVDVVTSGAEVVASIKATEDGDAEGHTVTFTAKKRTLDPTDLSFTTNDKAIRSDSSGNMEASKVSITDDGAVTINKIGISTITGNALKGQFVGTTTQQNKINFSAASSSSDPGFIVHETSSTTTNSATLHLSPSDDNQSTDYVSIHGRDDDETIKITTSGWLLDTVGIDMITGATIGNSTTTGSFIQFGGSGSGNNEDDDLALAATGDGEINLSIGGSVKMVIQAGIINLNNPVSASSTLSVTGAITAKDTLSVTDTISGAGPLTVSGAITGSSTLTVSGAITGNSTLSVSGTISGSSDISLTGTGTALDWVATSDKRLKENIQHLATQLDKVIEVGKQAISYSLKADDNKKRHLGFIAQDLEQIYPEFISGEETDETYLAVNYSKLVVPLYKAISEQQKIIDDLKRRIDKLENQ